MDTRMMPRVALLSLVIALTACGGGGGGSGPSSNEGGGEAAPAIPSEVATCKAPPCALTFSPAKVVSQHDAGEPRAVTLEVQVNVEIDGPLFVLVADPRSVFAPEIPLQIESETKALATLTVKDSVLPGRYRDVLQIRLCRNARCTREYPGSPLRLPYDVQVDSLVRRLTPLSAGGPDWTTHQGNAAHTGAVPISVFPENFARRWQWRVDGTRGVTDLSHVVTHRGKVYFSTNVGSSGGTARYEGNHVFAIDESTGEQLWRYDYPYIDGSTGPSAADGVVYAGANQSGSYSYWALDAESGVVLSRSGIGTQWRYYKAATVFGGRLYQHGGYNNGGIASFDLTNIALSWNNDLRDVTYPGAIAVDESYAYAVVYGTVREGTFVSGEAEGSLVLLDPTTGEIVKKIRPVYENAPPSLGFGRTVGNASPTPVITGINSVVLSYLNPVGVAAGSGINYRLEKIDTSTGTSVWRIDVPVTNESPLGAYSAFNPQSSDPVAIQGVLYVVNPASAKVEARRESDGQLLWSWAPPSEDRAALLAYELRASPVGTTTVLFVPTSRFVYGLDTATGKAVWRHGNTGQLAISGAGVLYISGKDRVDAINLR